MTDQEKSTEAGRTAMLIASSSFAVQLPFDPVAFWDGMFALLQSTFRRKSRALTKSGEIGD